MQETSKCLEQKRLIRKPCLDKQRSHTERFVMKKNFTGMTFNSIVCCFVCY